MGLFDFLKGNKKNNKENKKQGTFKDFEDEEYLLLDEETVKLIKQQKKLDELFDKYFPLYEKATELQRDKKIDEALEIYYKILNEYEPIGKVYYDNPVNILEKRGEITECIRILNLGVKNNALWGYEDLKELYQEKVKIYENKLKFIGNEKAYIESLKKYDVARNLERDKKLDEALSIYFEILKSSEGSVYFFERPAMILEKKKQFKEALEISLRGKNKFLNTEHKDYFDKRINRLEGKLNAKK